jgi:hypothetical protein
MLLLAATVAEKAYLSVRNFTGFLVSRYAPLQPDGTAAPGAVPTDIDTCRALNSLPKPGKPLCASLLIQLLWAWPDWLGGNKIMVALHKHNMEQTWRGRDMTNNFSCKNASICVSVRLLLPALVRAYRVTKVSLCNASGGESRS